MITKERLKELIKQDATIYHLSGIKKYQETKANDIPSFYRIDDFKSWEFFKQYYFETKKQAEWYLKYHKTRTEELDLPMFEDFIKEDNTVVKFWKNGHKITLYKYIKNRKTNNIRIMILDDREDCECWKFNKPATQENYIKACDLCLKLFKGEEKDEQD